METAKPRCIERIAVMGESARIKGLDGLRAVACLAVFGVHFQQIAGVGGRLGPVDLEYLLENGNRGVCLFFILTGFLLSLPAWMAADGSPRDAATKSGWLAAYARRRAARILPVYLPCLAVLVVTGGAWRGAHGLIDVVLHVLFLQNLAEFSFYSISSPLWALAVIVQFYVLFPILHAVLQRRPRSPAVRVGGVAAAAFVAYIAHAALMNWARSQAADWPLPQNWIRPDGYVLSLSLLAHLPHFLLGVFAAGFSVRMACRSTKDGPPWRSDAACWFAAAAVLGILAIPQWGRWLSIPHGRYNLPYVPLLMAVVIISAPRSQVAKAFLEFAPIRLLGVISYGVYIYHLPCLKLTARAMSFAGFSVTEEWPLLAVAGLGLSTAVAGASYVCVEQPVLRWARSRNLPSSALSSSGSEGAS